MKRTGMMVTVAMLAAALLSGCTGDAALKGASVGRNFIDEARWINTVLLCRPGDLPAGVDAAARERHCAYMKDCASRYRKNFIEKSRPFFDTVLPKNLPDVIVYPFGGSDLSTAIATFPAAKEITTLSLENAGDPRMIPRNNPAQQRLVMAQVRKVVGNYLLAQDNSNTNIHDADRILMGGQLTMSLAAASLFGMEAVSVRYFRLEGDGSIHYFTSDEIAVLEKEKGKRLHRAWFDLNYSVAFRNVEVIYRRPLADGKESYLVHRHFGANLNDEKLATSPVLVHLQKKGRITAMTKAASYLLWYDSFSIIRNYLLQNMAIMVSDSTGILPHHAQAAGFEQITYGRFNGAFLSNRGGMGTQEFRTLWSSQESRPINFRYGYSDDRGANHLLITRPKSRKT